MNSPKPREIDAVLQLDGASRYRHFVKRVVDNETAWGLWSDGWALMEDDVGRRVFPLWPAREYAELFLLEEWRDYVPERIGLQDLLDELLPKLAAAQNLLGVFPVPTGKGVTLSADELRHAIRAEMKLYE